MENNEVDELDKNYRKNQRRAPSIDFIVLKKTHKIFWFIWFQYKLYMHLNYLFYSYKLYKA